MNRKLVSRSGSRNLRLLATRGSSRQRLVRDMTSTSAGATKYLIYCCRRSISAFCPTICCLHLKCPRTISDASGTTHPHTTPMNAGCSSSKFSKALNKGVSSLIIRKGQWRLMGTPFLWTGLGEVAHIKKYQKKREREDIVGQEIVFDPHWGCPFLGSVHNILQYIVYTKNCSRRMF
jgi:hypothetical protein